MDDQRIGGRYVEAGFDDGGGQKNIIFAVIEGIHDVFQFPRRHLPMGNCDLQLRHVGLQEGVDIGEIGQTRQT